MSHRRFRSGSRCQVVTVSIVYLCYRTIFLSVGSLMRCMRGVDVFMTPRSFFASAPTFVSHYVMFEDQDPSERREPSLDQWYLLDGMMLVGQERVEYFNELFYPYRAKLY